MTAIDLGSNTIRFLNYDCDKKRELSSFEKVVRTAQDMHVSGVISEEAISRIVQAIDEAREKIGLSKNIKATATAAFRMAKNTSYVIRRIFELTAIKFEVIDADREAELTSLALFEAAKKYSAAKSMYILDIGGASTEIIYRDENDSVSKSFDIGIVTSANRFGSDEKALVSSLEKMLADIESFMKKITSDYSQPQLFAATSGTPTTLAAIKQGMTYDTYDKEKINSTMLSLRDINDAYRSLLKMDMDERARLIGSNRVDLVMCGVVIFREIFKRINYGHCVVYDDGLREGIAISACREKN